MMMFNSRNEGLNVFNDDNVAGATFYRPALAPALVSTGTRAGPAAVRLAVKLPAVKLLECLVGGAGD